MRIYVCVYVYIYMCIRIYSVCVIYVYIYTDMWQNRPLLHRKYIHIFGGLVNRTKLKRS